MPLNLPDKLPAIELLKEENIFVIDNSRATRQDIRPLQYSVAGGDFVHENQEPHLKEYSDRAYESFLYGFRQDA